ncbi:MAG: hypothetical protein AB2556_25380, partial [Candidatus Thiodiazotropha sp.]
AIGHSASSGLGSQALTAAAPLFWLQVSLMLFQTWPTELSNQSMLNCWVSFGGKPIEAQYCTRHSDCSVPP